MRHPGPLTARLRARFAHARPRCRPAWPSDRLEPRLTLPRRASGGRTARLAGARDQGIRTEHPFGARPVETSSTTPARNVDSPAPAVDNPHRRGGRSGLERGHRPQTDQTTTSSGQPRTTTTTSCVFALDDRSPSAYRSWGRTLDRVAPIAPPSAMPADPGGSLQDASEPDDNGRRGSYRENRHRTQGSGRSTNGPRHDQRGRRA